MFREVPLPDSGETQQAVFLFNTITVGASLLAKKSESGAGIQDARVIVDDLRE